MSKTRQIEKNTSTEEKILEAARRVFTQKGYAATRTRDIADESGYNLSLINYYFRSKEKLFDIIMFEHLQTFIHSIMGVVNDPGTTLQQKIEIVVARYIDMLIADPDLPLFMLTEIKADPSKLASKMGINKIDHQELYVVKQWNEMFATTNRPTIDPIHILMNVVSMTIFPFAAGPLIRNRTNITIERFNELMEERKKLIPIWIQAIITAS